MVLDRQGELLTQENRGVIPAYTRGEWRALRVALDTIGHSSALIKVSPYVLSEVQSSGESVLLCLALARMSQRCYSRCQFG